MKGVLKFKANFFLFKRITRCSGKIPKFNPVKQLFLQNDYGI